MRKSTMTGKFIYDEISKLIRRVHDLSYQLHDVEVKIGKDSEAYKTLEQVKQEALTDLEILRNQNFKVAVNREFKE